MLEVRAAEMANIIKKAIWNYLFLLCLLSMIVSQGPINYHYILLQAAAGLGTSVARGWSVNRALEAFRFAV